MVLCHYISMVGRLGILFLCNLLQAVNLLAELLLP